MAGLNGKYVGYVVDNKDPQKAGHCRVRVEHLMTNMEDDVLPWAKPASSPSFAGNGQGAISVPKVGVRVFVTFTGGSIFNPEYSAYSDVDTYLIEEIGDDYVDSQVLMYDKTNEVYVLFQPNRGLHLQYKGSEIQLSPDGMISIIHANNQSAIQLIGDKINIVSNGAINIGGDSNDNATLHADNVSIGGKHLTTIKGQTPNEYAVNGQALMRLLSSMAKLIDAKMPSSPGSCEVLVETSKMAVLNKGIKYE